MKLQTIFNKVYKHAMQMERKSQLEPGRCRYRDNDGGMCFIGCLIPDKNYTTTIEGHRASEPDVLKAAGIPRALAQEADDLQFIHDDTEMDEWNERLRGFAKMHNLKVPNA